MTVLDFQGKFFFELSMQKVIQLKAKGMADIGRKCSYTMSLHCQIFKVRDILLNFKDVVRETYLRNLKLSVHRLKRYVLRSYVKLQIPRSHSDVFSVTNGKYKELVSL